MHLKYRNLIQKCTAVILLLALIVCFVGCTISEPDNFEQRLLQLQEKIDMVTVAMQKAEGIAKTNGEINLNVARYFANYINWELKHPAITTDALARNDRWPRQEKLTEEQRTTRYNDHINRELTDAMTLLEETLTQLDKATATPDIKPINWNDMVFENGNFRVNGRVVFPGGFNILTRNLVNHPKYPNNNNPQWTKEDEDASISFLPEMRDMGVGIVGVSVPIGQFITSNNEIDQTIISEKISEIKQYEDLGLRVDLRLKWGGDKDLLEQLWPGITKHSGNGVPLDIDHPGTRELISKTLSEFVPQTLNRRAVLSWDMANEPFFDMKGWTEHGMHSFHAWLKMRHGTIASLNKAWQTNYASFNEIPKPKNKPTQPEYKPGERTAPPKINPSLDYSPGQWYDIVTFHNYRVASFFGFVASELRKYAPNAIVHMKGQDNNSLGPKRFAVTDGIDREMLTPAINLHGIDTRPLPQTEPRMAVIIDPDADNALLNYDESLYSFHWLGQSFLYDYLTSLEPNRPIVDMEYHAFSINPIRVPDIGPGHAKASLWMAHLHGMVANMVWYWNRRYGPNPFPSEEFKSWFYASISTQPIVVAEYFKTMKTLNRYSEEVNAFAKPAVKPLRIFVSKPSYIQNQKHIEALHRTYEAACFHGLPVGFVTEDMLVKSGIPNQCELIVIPDAQYVSTKALKQLQIAKQSGVKLIQVGRQSITNDEYGLLHAEKDLLFLKDIPVLDYASAPELDLKFAGLMQPITAQNPATVKIKGGQNAFGIMNRFAEVDGRSLLLLVNLTSNVVDVELKNNMGKTINGYDLLHMENIQGDGIQLAVKDVRLIEISE